MADFSVRAAHTFGSMSILRTPPWTDPATATSPTRLNVRADVQHRYYQVFMNGSPSTSLRFECTVNGVVTPADGALGGRLFTWSMSLVPIGAPEPMFSVAGGFTSIASIPLLAAYPGHYRALVNRPGSGSIGIPFDVELMP